MRPSPLPQLRLEKRCYAKSRWPRLSRRQSVWQPRYATFPTWSGSTIEEFRQLFLPNSLLKKEGWASPSTIAASILISRGMILRKLQDGATRPVKLAWALPETCYPTRLILPFILTDLLLS